MNLGDSSVDLLSTSPPTGEPTAEHKTPPISRNGHLKNGKHKLKNGDTITLNASMMKENDPLNARLPKTFQNFNFDFSLSASIIAKKLAKRKKEDSESSAAPPPPVPMVATFLSTESMQLAESALASGVNDVTEEDEYDDDDEESAVADVELDDNLKDLFADLIQKEELTKAPVKSEKKKKAAEPEQQQQEKKAEEKPKKRRAKRRRVETQEPEPYPCNVQLNSTLDAQPLLKHCAKRLAHYEQTCRDLETLNGMLRRSESAINDLYAPVGNYLETTEKTLVEGLSEVGKRLGSHYNETATDVATLKSLLERPGTKQPFAIEMHTPLNNCVKAFKAYKVSTDTKSAIDRLAASVDRQIKAVQVLQRAQNSCALEIKRLCLCVEAIINASIAAHDIRRLPGVRQELVRPVLVEVEGRDDVYRRVAPPPIPTAVDAEHAIDAQNSMVRVVKAVPVKREQSIVPSLRSNLITESVARMHWNPRDISTAWRLTRARTAAQRIRERRTLRRVNANPLAATVPLLGATTTQLRRNALGAGP